MRHTENKEQNGRISPPLTITTLNTNELSSPIKGRDWKNGFLKILIQLYAVY